MRKKTFHKKLTLSKETIANLNSNDIRLIFAGADLPTNAGYTCYTCDPENFQCATWWVWECTSTCTSLDTCDHTATGGYGTACPCPS